MLVNRIPNHKQSHSNLGRTVLIVGMEIVIWERQRYQKNYLKFDIRQKKHSVSYFKVILTVLSHPPKQLKNKQYNRQSERPVRKSFK